MADKQYKHPHLPERDPVSPFEYAGGAFIQKHPFQSSDFVPGKSGYQMDPTGQFSKVNAFGGNVTLYDAVVDASGKGQFKSIQDALDAGKKRIFVRAGTYYIDNPIIIEKNEITIFGEDFNSTIIKASTLLNVNSLLRIGFSSSRSNINISNLTFDCELISTGASSFYTGTLYICNASNVNINYCKFINAPSALNQYHIHVGLDYNNIVSNIEISNCSFGDASQVIKISAASNGVRILRNTFVFAGSLGVGIFSASYDVIISDNYITNGGYSIVVGSQSTSAANDICEKNIISNNVIKNPTAFGIGIRGQSSAYGTKERNFNIISNNIIDESSRGIELYPATYNNISNNIILNCATAGIWVRANDGQTAFSKYNVIVGNSIVNESTPGQYGIAEEYSGCDYNLISNNLVKNVSSYKIRVLGANTIEANNI